MCNEYQVLNRHDEMLRSMLLYLDKARKYKNRLREAVALLYLGDTYSRDGAHEKGLQHLRAAQEILRTQTGNKKVTDYLLWSRELEAEACFRAGDYSGAIRITRDLIAWYGRLTRQQRAGTEVEEDRNLNFRQAQNHISLARLYALNGETAQAAGAYAEAQRLLANTDKVLSPQMHELALDYLKAAGRYPEALRRAWQYLDEARVGDTVNLFNLAAKRQLSDIYRHLGDYPHAWNMEHQAAVLADSLYCTGKLRDRPRIADRIRNDRTAGADIAAAGYDLPHPDGCRDIINRNCCTRYYPLVAVVERSPGQAEKPTAVRAGCPVG